ncbi:MAG: ABC transporter permease [Phycisphaerae bacterium]|nr:ABC transporter permease [Gemmatimonadaceae bacterium]
MALRSLTRVPYFSLLAMCTLALGIGLATAVFSVAETLLLRKLPVRDQSRVVVVAGTSADGRTANFPLSLTEAQEFLAGSRALTEAALHSYEGAAPVSIREGDRITRLGRALVSGNYFAVLDATPVLGRALVPDDDVAGAELVAVISYRAWKERFGGRADVIDSRIVMFDRATPYRVVGVMPQGLDIPRGVEVWTAMLATVSPENTPYLAVNVVGRMHTTATLASAGNEMTAYFSRPEASRFQREVRGTAQTISALTIGDMKPAIIAFACAASLLLLITCFNVASLLIVRGLGRMREVAVRFALGASRGRVAAGLMTEHFLLAFGGGVLAVGVAWATLRLFVLLAPRGTPRVDEIGLNGIALSIAFSLALLTALALSIGQAFMTSQREVERTLRGAGREGTTRASRRASEVLVAVQLGIALVVLSGSALLVRSLIHLERAELSFDDKQLYVAELAMRADRYETAAKQYAMLRELLPALNSTPSIAGVSPVVAVPYSVTGWDAAFAAEGQEVESTASNPLLNMELVTPEYFPTLKLRTTLGRTFSEADREGAIPVVMLSQSAARHYWGNESAIGKRIILGQGERARTFTVVGVVPDTRYRNLRTALPTVYLPMAQSFFPFAPTALILRSPSSEQALETALRLTLRNSAPDVALLKLAPFDEFRDVPLAQTRMNVMLLSVFAVGAVLLASVGLFGSMATMVLLRRREFGVRMALGATATNVGAMVLRRAIAIAGLGCAGGLALAAVANQLLGALLYEVSTTDFSTLSLTALALLLVATVAALVPARAGTRVSPLEAMRAE